MSNIYDFPLSFSLVKKYVIISFKRFYGEYIVVGRENIPNDGPVIFAPNHLSALMDALAVHSVAPHKLPVIFLGRADIFKNKTAAKILNFIKIMPAFRMRDGVENLGKNDEIFERCVEVLDHNKALGIMPEGNQGEQRKLRPLVKGIFRIAFAAQQKYGTQPGVKIIPVGIDLGDLIKFGKHIIINIGKPIEVSEYMTEFAENPVSATNIIRERLRSDLNTLSLNLATETHYECFETATEVANTAVLQELRFPDKTIFRLVARHQIAERLVALEKYEPEKIEKMELLCEEYKSNLKSINLRTWTLEEPTLKTTSLLLDGFMLFGTLPVFLIGLILNFLPFFMPVFIRKAMKSEYTGFYSSLHFGLGLVTFPLFYLLQTILFCCLLNTQWWGVLLFVFSQYYLGKLAFHWYCEAKRYMAKLRYRKLEREKSPVLEKTQSLRTQIIQMIKK